MLTNPPLSPIRGPLCNMLQIAPKILIKPMKKIFIFTLIILSYSIFSQNYNNYLHNSNTGSFDKSGKKVGDWKEYEMKGESKIIGIGKYKNGFRINKWKFYWSNGKLAEIGKYNKKG